MKRFGLLILPMVCLIGCNKDNTPKENILTREELINILPTTSIGDIKIKSIEVSWNNISKKETTQGILKRLGATDAYEGNNTVTDSVKANSIREQDETKKELTKASINKYFVESETVQFVYKERAYEVEIDYKSTEGSLSASYTYMKSNGVIKTFTITKDSFTITDKFNYSYI